MTKLVIRSYDEEYGFPNRVSRLVEAFLQDENLDTVNKEYIIVVELLPVDSVLLNG